MVANRTMPACSVIPQLVYDDVAAAVEWLCATFGFAERWRAGTHRAQLDVGNDGCVVVAERETSAALPGRQSVLIRVADVTSHHARSLARGAKVLGPPTDHAYGERQYTVQDPEGHQWSFSESIADVAPEAWGGVSGPGLGTGAPDAGAPDSAAPDGAGPDPAGAAGNATRISAMLIVGDAAAAVDWYQRALGARVLWDLGGVAALDVAGAPFLVHETNPGNAEESDPLAAGRTTTRVELFSATPDALLARALEHGARGPATLSEHQLPWGTHRQGGFHDPFGHRWSVGDLTPLGL